MSIGRQLEHAEMFYVKRRHHRHAIGYTLMHIHETKPHALSHANTLSTEEQEDRAREEAQARAMFDALDPIDREILRCANQVTGTRERTLPFNASAREDAERQGWLYTKTIKGGRVLMVKTFPCTPTQDELGEMFHMRIAEVRRRLCSVSALVVRLAIEKGWF